MNKKELLWTQCVLGIFICIWRSVQEMTATRVISGRTTQPFKPKNHPSHLPPQATVMTAGLRRSVISLLVKSFPWNTSKPHFYLTTLLVFSRLLSFLLIAGAMPRLVSLREIKRNPVILSTRLPVIHIHFSPLTSSLLHCLLNGAAEEGHRQSRGPPRRPPLQQWLWCLASLIFKDTVGTAVYYRPNA